jgi:F-type H+-transporting ATPase subunit b
MRLTAALSLLLSCIPSIALAAQEEARPSLLSPVGGLMIWTLAVFLGLMFLLSRFAFKPLLAAVEAREKSLEDAIQAAQRDREEAARFIVLQKEQLEAARAEAQRFIADARLTAEKLKASMLEETKAQQQEMMERARRELESEKLRAIADMRREAVDLALAGASKVIERNLDDSANRKLVEDFLGTIPGGKR